MDREAFRRAVEEHKDRVYGFAVYMLHDVEEARDVAQESFVRLWENRSKVPDDAAARAWLNRTAHNLCIDRLRSRSLRPSVHFDGTSFPLSSPDAGPDRSAGARETRRAIARALAGLPARDRALLVLREIQGESYREISRALDLPLGTVKAALHRARERLRERLTRAGLRP